MGEDCDICGAILHDGKIEAVRGGGQSYCRSCAEAATVDFWMAELRKVAEREDGLVVQGIIYELEERLHEEARAEEE